MPQEGDAVTDNESEVPVGEEQTSTVEVVDTQVDSEDKQLSNQEINWKRANETMRDQSEQLRALRSELQRLTQPKEEPSPELEKGSILTYGEAEQVFGKKIDGLLNKISELETRVGYPDMTSVIEKYGKALPESVKRAVLNAENPHLAAYEACLNSEAYYKDTLANSTKHENAKRVESNLKKAGNASSVGTPGALSQAGIYEKMSFDELIAASNKAMFG